MVENGSNRIKPVAVGSPGESEAIAKGLSPQSGLSRLRLGPLAVAEVARLPGESEAHPVAVAPRLNSCEFSYDRSP